MGNVKTLRAAARIVRSRGVGVILLALGWIAWQQSAGWGQRPDAGGSTPAPVKKVATGSGNPAPVTSSPVSQNVSGNFGGGVPGGGFTGNGFTGNGGGSFPGAGFCGSSGFGGSGFGGFSGVLTPPQRFSIKIDGNTSVANLLPVPPVMPSPLAPWLVRDLSQVPEVFFQKVLPTPTLSEKDLENKTDVEKTKLKIEFATAIRQNAIAHAAQTLGKINHVNQKGTDRFVHLLVQHRLDLDGLPFVMGDDCRMSKSVSRQFVAEVGLLKGGGFGGFNGFQGGGGFNGGLAPAGVPANNPNPAPPKPSADDVSRAKVAAMMQILGPEQAPRRLQMVKDLTAIDHAEATRALARLTVFSFEKEVRDAAVATLKNRPSEAYDSVLVQALRYPWPAVAQHAADAVVNLKRRDLAPHLVNLLDEPDPRAPAFRDDQCVPTVREVVRLNHHHNCITCHAPATSDAEFNNKGFSTDFVSAPVTLPGGDPAPQTFGYGFSGPSLSPDIFVRVDVTYLRQDFSLMKRVDNAPTAAPQRFDFLVRTREVTMRDVDAYHSWRKAQGAGYRPPYHQMAQTALRQLTGRNAEATATAWRQVLNGSGK